MTIDTSPCVAPRPMPPGWVLRPGIESARCTALVIGTVELGDRAWPLCHHHTRELALALLDMGFVVEREAGTAEASELVRPMSKRQAEALERTRRRLAARR